MTIEDQSSMTIWLYNNRSQVGELPTLCKYGIESKCEFIQGREPFMELCYGNSNHCAFNPEVLANLLKNSSPKNSPLSKISKVH